ncbi:LOG family protein [Halarcobacter bivalviorum]|uniref:LOG family protein n=1 Tax=Halarcobacter bivalviorum TaxID=663364 RepID=UPI00100A6E94|nr:TIGR00730 family Rossman fold protein [Halarcobacter bivalviorum]RXK08176.1 TIGR00730 family Rossman fold protein [Halarcobacter bivalviorum]
MNIAIYCGSSFGKNEIYKTTALNMVDFLAKESCSIVYGGSKAGLMGIISNYALEKNIPVYGVITHDLANKELENERLSNIIKVDSIRERKAKMEELSDAFIAYPGGCGTLEEISEILTSIQVGYSNKPCAFYNVNGYYDKLIEFLNTAVKEGFMLKEHLDSIIISDNIEKIYTNFKNYTPPKNKWEILKALTNC